MTDFDAPGYIRANFDPTDRLAVVLVNRRTESVIQRLASAEQIAAADFQKWLHEHNQRRYDVYVGMNVLRPEATGRRKEDLAAIRHVYLDFDRDGDASRQALLKREDIPRPNYVLSTSPGKWQVVWRVHQFGKEEAERLQRGMARATGADTAATDSSRCLRLPGFFNHKYNPPYQVRVEAQSGAARVSGPKEFPHFDDTRIHGESVAPPVHQNRARGEISQSEKDWAYAKRALSRGDPEDFVIAAIATHRRFDKYSPQDYARRTVQRAREALRGQGVLIEDHRNEPGR